MAKMTEQQLDAFIESVRGAKSMPVDDAATMLRGMSDEYAEMRKQRDEAVALLRKVESVHGVNTHLWDEVRAFYARIDKGSK